MLVWLRPPIIYRCKRSVAAMLVWLRPPIIYRCKRSVAAILVWLRPPIIYRSKRSAAEMLVWSRPPIIYRCNRSAAAMPVWLRPPIIYRCKRSVAVSFSLNSAPGKQRGLTSVTNVTTGFRLTGNPSVPNKTIDCHRSHHSTTAAALRYCGISIALFIILSWGILDEILMTTWMLSYLWSSRSVASRISNLKDK